VFQRNILTDLSNLLVVNHHPCFADNSDFRDILEKCAATSMSSKLIHSHKDFFKKMVVDAVLHLDQEELSEKMIGIKKVAGGAMQDSLFVDGVAFKKTFSYAGFEQQPKSFKNPKILCLNVELELKAERDNAEVRVEAVQVCIVYATMAFHHCMKNMC
jgi:T-complex protein 1 subunit eta